MLFHTALFNTQHYKVRIKGKVEQSSERRSALPYIFVLHLMQIGYRVKLD